MLSLALASSLKQISQTSSPRVAFNPERDFIPACSLSYYLNLLPMIKVWEISHKYLDVRLLFKSQEMEQHGASRPCVKLAQTRSSCPAGMELLFLKASQSPLLLAVSHPAHSARWVACLAEQGWGAGTLLLMVPTVSFWKEQVLKTDSRPRCHWLVTFWASSASSRKWNLKLSAWICVMLGTFIFTINIHNVQFTISAIFNCLVQWH